MTAQSLTIEAKHRQMVSFLASLADFTTIPGEQVDPNIVLSNRNFSLYCLDDATQRAIFVELPSNVNLATAPFVYQVQYEQAERLVAMPYETFRDVARQLPTVQHLILIYSSGRGGSTLMSHIFNALDSVLSLSEPDAAFQFIHLRRSDGLRDAELRDLLDCTIRMLFKPTAFKSPTTSALKFRLEATQLMDFYQAAFPQAKNLYVYRDAIGFITSLYGLFNTVGLPDDVPVSEFMASFEQIVGFDPTRLIAYLDPGTECVSIPQQAALIWINAVELYLAQYAKGIPVLAVRYADLNHSQEPVISAIFDYCGLPKERAKETLGVFERDAQAGTALARENPNEGNKLRLTEEEHAAVTRILARHPVIKKPDFAVPGTLTV
jgi:hypothetical protein